MGGVFGITPFSSVRDLWQASDGMGDSGRFLESIQDKLDLLLVFEYMLEGVAVKGTLFLMLFPSSNSYKSGSQVKAGQAKEKRYRRKCQPTIFHLKRSASRSGKEGTRC